jgi:uncharacterized integral membrane protein (TIGR00698 family)
MPKSPDSLTSSSAGSRPLAIAHLTVFGAGLVAAVAFGTPASALFVGFVLALIFRFPRVPGGREATKWLLQACVVFLGFGMNLSEVARIGLNGSLFAAVSIAATLGLGRCVGNRLQLDRRTSVLLSVGTAICGGSAIAAVSAVVAATEAEIAVSIGTIFMLNAVALYLFPAVGHLLRMGEGQFGLWAGVAIQDISSVVGAGISYGPLALATATAVKLSRTLWIVPVTLLVARQFSPPSPAAPDANRKVAPIAIPWFIAAFLAASLFRSFVPPIAEASPILSSLARRGMIAVLFLVGTSLSVNAIKSVGWRSLAMGVALWAFLSAGSLAVIRLFHLGL